MSQITVQVQVSDAFRELGYSDEELRQEVPVLLRPFKGAITVCP